MLQIIVTRPPTLAEGIALVLLAVLAVGGLIEMCSDVAPGIRNRIAPTQRSDTDAPPRPPADHLDG